MGEFAKLLTAPEEELVKRFYVFREITKEDKGIRLQSVAKKFKLRPSQLTCALGFNDNVKELTDIIPILGFDTYQDLLASRNEIFQNDIYQGLSLENILAIYATIRNSDSMLAVMPYLLRSRLSTIERKIEATVNSIVIDKYKAEMKAIYSDHIVGIDFVEERLDMTDSGFRALLNEVTVITESKIIPAGEIFYRASVLPEEKRKLLMKGLIPLELVEARLEDDATSQEEKKMLYDYLKSRKSH